MTTRHSAVALLVTIAAAAFSLYSVQPPASVPANAPASEFSADRAMEYVRHIAAIPHPTGSPANAAAREYILSVFRQMGLNPQVQETVGAWREGRHAEAAFVRNIVARLPGSQGPKAVLLAGHYDSVASGPGAGDDGHAVGGLLETLRALRTGPALRNDVIFLLTDGEELGMLGAAAFVNEHPWAADAAVVLNFEARGTGGPAHMFETSEGNGWLIRQFAQAAPYPRTDSVSYEVYRRLPNDTDLTVFKRHGYSGLNSAFIENVFFYHTPYDDLAHLDRGSVQQQGSNALALARQFGNADLSQTKAPDAIYFTAPFRHVVVYSQTWAWPLAVVTWLALLALIGHGLRRGALTVGGMGGGALAFLLSLMAAPAATAGLWRLMVWIHPLPSATSIQPYNWRWDEAAFLALTVAIVAAIYGWFHRRLTAAGLAAGGLLVWAVVMTVCCALVPTASYLFTWPLLFSLPAFWAGLSNARSRTVWLAVSGAVAAWFVIFYVDQLFVAMTVSMGWLPAVLLVLLLGLLAPMWLFAARRTVALAFLGLCLAALVGGALTSGFTAAHPKPSTVFYALDAGSGRAVWVSDALVPDPWIAQFIPDVKRRAPLPAFFRSQQPWPQAVAPALSLPAPEVKVLDNQIAGNSRSLTFQVRSARQATGLLLVVSPAVQVRGLALNGHAFEPDRAGADFPLGILSFEGAPPEGIRCQLELDPQVRLKLSVVDCTDGVPGNFQPRPPYVMRSILYWMYNETTVVGREFTIP